MESSITLSDADEMFARLKDSPEIVGAVAVFSGQAPDIRELRTRVTERWGSLSRLAWVLRRPAPPRRFRSAGRHHWAAIGHFDPADHVVPAADGRGLVDLLSDLVRGPLPADRPPWQLHLVRDLPDGAFALVLTAHHSLLDGQSLMTLLGRLLDGPRLPRQRHGTATPPDHVPRQPAGGKVTARGLRHILAPGAGIPPAQEDRTRPEFSWTPMDPSALRAARRALSGRLTTLNELAMAAAAGALAATYGAPPAGMKGTAPMYALIGVSLRTNETAQELGNLISGLRVPCPVDQSSPMARLAACRGLVASVAQRHHPATLAHVVTAASRMGPWALDAFVSHGSAATWAPVGCVALRWPHGPASLDGRPMVRLIGVPVQPAPRAVTFMLISYADAASLSVASHHRPGDAPLLADAFVREVDDLARLGRSRAFEESNSV